MRHFSFIKFCFSVSLSKTKSWHTKVIKLIQRNHLHIRQQNIYNAFRTKYIKTRMPPCVIDIFIIYLLFRVDSHLPFNRSLNSSSAQKWNRFVRKKAQWKYGIVSKYIMVFLYFGLTRKIDRGYFVKGWFQYNL